MNQVLSSIQDLSSKPALSPQNPVSGFLFLLAPESGLRKQYDQVLFLSQAEDLISHRFQKIESALIPVVRLE